MSERFLYDSKEWKYFPLDTCYCLYSPVVAGHRIWRCNICVNEIIEDKNQLVRENYDLLRQMKERGDGQEKKEG